MDPQLLKERELFKKRALANAIVKEKQEKSSKKSHVSVPKYVVSKEDHTNNSLTLNATSTVSQQRFAILAKVVKHLRDRYLKGYCDYITLEEIFEEMRLMDVMNKTKLWLENEALPNNPKIKITFNAQNQNQSQNSSENNIKILSDETINAHQCARYMFHAPLDIKDKKSLLKLLAYRDEHGLGGILLEDIEESLPHADKIISQIEDSVVMITRPGDKKKVLFYDDESCKFSVHPDFVKLWKGISVENTDELEIEQYLRNKGLNAIKINKPIVNHALDKKRRINRTKKAPKPLTMKFNEHMATVLQDYSTASK